MVATQRFPVSFAIVVDLRYSLFLVESRHNNSKSFPVLFAIAPVLLLPRRIAFFFDVFATSFFCGGYA